MCFIFSFVSLTAIILGAKNIRRSPITVHMTRTSFSKCLQKMNATLGVSEGTSTADYPILEWKKQKKCQKYSISYVCKCHPKTEFHRYFSNEVTR